MSKIQKRYLFLQIGTLFPFYEGMPSNMSVYIPLPDGPYMQVEANEVSDSEVGEG